MRRQPTWVWLLLVAVFALYFFTRLYRIKSPYMFYDEAVYIDLAMAAKHGSWWASMLHDGRPPLHYWSMVPFLMMFRDPLVAGRVASVIFGAFTTLGIVLLGYEFKDLRLGALAGLFWVIIPFSLIFERLAIAESLLQAFFVFAIYFAVKAAKGRYRWLLGTGLCTGLALWTKGSAQLLYVVVPCAYLVKGPAQKGRDGRRPLLKWLAASIAALVFGFALLNLLRLSPVYSQSSHFVATRSKTLLEALKTIGQFRFFVRFITGQLAYYLTVPLMVLCVIGLMLALIRKWRPSYFLWAWLLLGTAFIALASKYGNARFYLVLVPPLVFGVAYLTLAAADAGKAVMRGRKWTWRSVGVGLVILVLIASLVIVFVARPLEKRFAHELVDGFFGDQQPQTYMAAIGLDEAVAYLNRQSADHKITVFADTFFFKVALEDYLVDNPNVTIVMLHKREPEESLQTYRRDRQEVEAARKAGDVYFVLDYVQYPVRLTQVPFQTVAHFYRPWSGDKYTVILKVPALPPGN